jgi:hypothetical protein
VKNNTDWLFELDKKIPSFLEKLKGEKNPGFFHYSLSGDFCDENVKWGLGNTVFAVKIYYTLNLLEFMPQHDRQIMSNFIKSFQASDGMIFDPLVRRKSLSENILRSMIRFNFGNYLGKQVKIAETRQSISALKLLGEKPDIIYQKFPSTKDEIDRYLSKLDWRMPWGAGSHFSHLIFFLNNSDKENKEELIDFAIGWINKLQHSEDGSWYRSNTSIQQKVNGAMKIITGFKVADKMEIFYPEKLIDLCLSTTNNKEACDNFNIIYVLHYANKASGGIYKKGEIMEFALDRLKLYRTYYFPEIGGFSFFPDRSNDCYYGAKITKGLKEPDIHGTVMFLWGISIISQILEIDDKLKFNEQVP